MSPTDLSGLVREVVDVSDETDPPVLAKLIADRIPDDDLRSALEQALPVLVRREFRRYSESWTAHPSAAKVSTIPTSAASLRAPYIDARPQGPWHPDSRRRVAGP